MKDIIFGASYENYNFLVQKFLNEEMNGFEFRNAFLKLWYFYIQKARKLMGTIEDEDKNNQIPYFSYTFKSIIFHQVIDNVFWGLKTMGWKKIKVI